MEVEDQGWRHEANHDRYKKAQLQRVKRNELPKGSIGRLKTISILLWRTETSKPHTPTCLRLAIIFGIISDEIF